MKTAFQTRNRLWWEAFTLVEMMAVMAIIVVLIGIVAPAIVGRNAARQLTDATYQITGVIDRARADAMARNTYRYVAVETANNGGPPIRLKTLGMRPHGRFTGDPSSALQLLSPVIVLSNVQIVEIPPDSPPARPAADKHQNFAYLYSNVPAYLITFGQVFTKAYLLELAPNGQAELLYQDSTGASGPPVYKGNLCHWMEIGLQPTHGSAVSAQPTAANRAVVQIAGLTGQTQIYVP